MMTSTGERRAGANMGRPAVARFPSAMRCPLDGVSLSAWQRFVAALEVQGVDAVSERGGFGSYDLRPKRLRDLGYTTDLRRVRARGGRQIYTCSFVAPWTQERFLADPLAQLGALAQSMKLHQQDLRAGKIRLPDGLSLSGALAILHRGGRGALAAWPDLFDHTRAVFERARGAF